MSFLLGLQVRGLGDLPAFFNHARGDGIDFKCAMAVPLSSLNPAHRSSVRGCMQSAACDAAKIICNYIVVAHTAVFTMNTVEEFDEFKNLDLEAGFFAHLADYAFDERFANLKHASGQGPLAFHGIAAPLDEQDTTMVHDHRANAYQRRLRKFSLHETNSTFAFAGSRARD